MTGQAEGFASSVQTSVNAHNDNQLQVTMPRLIRSVAARCCGHMQEPCMALLAGCINSQAGCICGTPLIKNLDKLGDTLKQQQHTKPQPLSVQRCFNWPVPGAITQPPTDSISIPVKRALHRKRLTVQSRHVSSCYVEPVVPRPRGGGGHHCPLSSGDGQNIQLRNALTRDKNTTAITKTTAYNTSTIMWPQELDMSLCMRCIFFTPLFIAT
jgi:hypothetical protein